jgi:hypothetical protein
MGNDSARKAINNNVSVLSSQGSALGPSFFIQRMAGLGVLESARPSINQTDTEGRIMGAESRKTVFKF